MSAARRALAVDFSLAAGATSVGALGVGGSLVWTTAIAPFGGTVLVCVLYLAEQTQLSTLVDEYSPRSYVVAFAVTLTVGLVLVVGWQVVVSPAAPLLLGMGIGLASYRLRYGVVGPVPEQRLTQATGHDTIEPPGQS